MLYHTGIVMVNNLVIYIYINITLKSIFLEH